MRLYWVERARTVWSLQDRIEGRVPLDALPMELDRLRLISQALPTPAPEAVFCADAEPDKASAQVFAEAFGIARFADARLASLDMGAWAGLRRNEVRDRYGRQWRQWRARPDVTAAPEGETMLEAAERMRPAVRKMCARPAAVFVSDRETGILVLTYLLGRPDNAGSPWQALEPAARWAAVDVDI